ATPAVSLSNKVLTVGQYAIPPKARQPGSGDLPGTTLPQGDCLNDETTVTIAGSGCWKLLLGTTSGALAVHNATKPEHVMTLDSNDTRMQQVMYANGKLWGALDSAVSVGGANRAGIAYFIVNPSAAKIILKGHLGVDAPALT